MQNSIQQGGLMKFRIGIIAYIAFSSATLALAKTRITGTAVCSGPEQVHVMRLGDQADHFFVMSQGKCRWTKPFGIAGTKTQSDQATVTKEVLGSQASVRGYVTETAASGDKFSYHIMGEQVIDHGKTVSEHGRWTIVNGTGKLQGLKGKGTYAGKLEGKNMVFDLKGEYQAMH
jgi:hypothetical protein